MSVAGFQAEMRISCVCAELLTKILKRCKILVSCAMRHPDYVSNVGVSVVAGIGCFEYMLMLWTRARS